MSTKIDVLIHKHLEGKLSEAERAEFGARLVAEPEVARRLAEMAFEQEALREALETARAPRFRKSMLLSFGAAALLLIGVGAALWIGPGVAPDVVPAAAFQGRVRGVVLSRTEAPALRFRVTEAAGHPLAGRTIYVAPGFQRSDAGEPIPHKLHPAFLRRLEPEQEAELDLRHVGDDLYLLGELTREQAEAVKRDVKKIPREKDGKKPVERGDRDVEKEER